MNPSPIFFKTCSLLGFIIFYFSAKRTVVKSIYSGSCQLVQYIIYKSFKLFPISYFYGQNMSNYIPFHINLMGIFINDFNNINCLICSLDRIIEHCACAVVISMADLENLASSILAVPQVS